MAANSNVQPVVLDQSNEYITAINDVFNSARVKDEFEYICALLRIRGLENPGWDELEESFALFKELTSLVQAPFEAATKIRLLLSLYAHMTGADSVYWTLANMLLTAQGKGCQADPFSGASNGNGATSASHNVSPKSMVNMMIRDARHLKKNNFAELLSRMFNEDVRRAFVHNTYRLNEDEFETKEGMFAEESYFSDTENKFATVKTEPRTIKLGELVNLLNSGLTFFQAFNFVRMTHARSYQSEKVIDTKFGSTLLLTHPEYGLIGFEVRNEQPPT